MGKFRRIPKLFIFWFIVISLQIISSTGDPEVEIKEERPSLQQFVVETISTLRKSHKSSWDKVKSFLNEMQLKFSPPNLDFKGPNEVNIGAGMEEVEKVKDAAKKSAGVSKMVVEESAKSAAKAVQKTADKVKDSVSSDNGDSHEEL